MNNDLKKKISEMSDHELIEIVHQKPHDYTKEAKSLAKSEIDKREIKDEQVQEILKEKGYLSDDKVYSYIATNSLTNSLLFLLKATIVLMVMAVISGFLEINLLNDIKSGNFDYSIEDKVSANDLRQQIIGIIQMILFVITGIVFLRWIYFSNANSRALGAKGMRFTPGWSVGWYFVPIMHFFKPYQAMKEIWRTSKDPENWGLINTPSLLSNWWALWVISAILGQLSLKLSLRAEEINELLTSSWVTLISDIIEIPLALVAIKMVTKIFRMQKEKQTPNTSINQT